MMERPAAYIARDKKTKWMAFQLVKVNQKTTRWTVVVRSSGGWLGEIEWYGPWRQYIFEPRGERIFNNGCLQEISKFLVELNTKQRAGGPDQ